MDISSQQIEAIFQDLKDFYQNIRQSPIKLKNNSSFSYIPGIFFDTMSFHDKLFYQVHDVALQCYSKSKLFELLLTPLSEMQSMDDHNSS